MQDIIEKVNNSSWADWILEKIEIDFDTIIVNLGDGDETVSVRLMFKDYIGFEMIGQWDESIIKDIKIEKSGNLIDDSLTIVKEKYGDDPLAWWWYQTAH
ncbi:MAG: hypothetical protein ACM3UZ_14160 [Acidobacteriota bacterium]